MSWAPGQLGLDLPEWMMPLTPAEVDAVQTLRRSLGLDLLRTYGFWENVVARMLGGEPTSHGCGWDVEVPYGEDAVRVEVKYAQESRMRFRGIPRPVLKFAAPKGEARDKAADVIVLLGVDAEDRVWTWIVPAQRMRRCASITITSPRARVRIGERESRSQVDAWSRPFDQMLPEVLRAYRTHLGVC